MVPGRGRGGQEEEGEEDRKGREDGSPEMEWADGRAVPRRGLALPARAVWGLGGGADGKGGEVPVRPALGVIVVGLPDAEER